MQQQQQMQQQMKQQQMKQQVQQQVQPQSGAWRWGMHRSPARGYDDAQQQVQQRGAGSGQGSKGVWAKRRAAANAAAAGRRLEGSMQGAPVLRAEERVGGWLLEAMCELPKLPIQPTKEGSTGLLRSFV